MSTTRTTTTTSSPDTTTSSTTVTGLTSGPGTVLRRAAAVAALAAAGVLVAAGAASAHVTVHPESYAKGATDGVLTFRVPNEDDAVTTTEVQVFLPTDHPVLGVLVSPRDGWTASVKNTRLKTPVKTDDGTITDAVSEITWTGGKIAAGQFEDFDVAFGQLPDDVGRLTFKTLQTYSDGKTVRWIEEAAAGADEPENPAPVLDLTAKGADRAAQDGAGAAVPSVSAKSSASAASASGDDSTARGLGAAGLAVGVLGLAAAAFAVVRGRSAGSRPE
ncbi:YcnI family protein [Streptomyces asoensis]|uniref:YcnI family protein n=1 Tax=Streptomyces asoensis TaxID=249586 RepID=UPI0036B804CB